MNSIWTQWNWDPLLALGLGFAAWRFLEGLLALRQRGRPLHMLRIISFVLGLLAVFAALVSPLDTLAEQLLSAHMVQHLLLMLIAPPLLIYGAPTVLIAWAVPNRWRRPLAQWWNRQSRFRWLGSMVSVWGIYAVTLWGWHVPDLYQAALHSRVIHMLEHTTFFATSMLYWWRMMSIHRMTAYGGAILASFTTAVHSSILGALMTFSVSAWYPIYDARTTTWGLTALEDQQLAGIIMWIPAGLIYLAAVLGLLAQWLNRMDQRNQSV